MECPGEAYARNHRLNAVNVKTFFNFADLGYIRRRLIARQGVAVPPAANGRRQRGAGGAKPVPKIVSQDPPLEYSDKVASAFSSTFNAPTLQAGLCVVAVPAAGRSLASRL